MKRVLTIDEEKAVEELLVIVKAMIEHLSGEDKPRVQYEYLEKVMNILSNKSINGFKNVKRHLFMNFRVIRDNFFDDEYLSDLMNDSYLIASSNTLFNS